MKKSFLILYTRTRDGRIGRMEEREDGDYMAFSVYGTFTEPEKGVNFFVIRCKPTKRDAFPRKLKTAINALVQPWYKEEDRYHDKNRKRFCDQDIKCWWNVDGEGTTFYHNGLHARSMEFEPHPSRERIKAIHAEVGYEIPENYRVCGENLTAVHSIRYEHLPSYFMVFNIWNGLTCLSWDETMEWSALLGLWTVPLIYWGPYSDDLCQELYRQLNPETQEGLVVRPARAFSMVEFPYVVGKYVRAKHVQTDQHWMRKPVEFNGLEPR